MENKEERKIWIRTTVIAIAFILFYGVMQYIIAREIEPISLLVGTVAFWLVYFIIQKAMLKQIE